MFFLFFIKIKKEYVEYVETVYLAPREAASDGASGPLRVRPFEYVEPYVEYVEARVP